MIKVLKTWAARYFSDEQALTLFIVILLFLSAVLVVGDILAPVIASVILAFLMQGMVNVLVKRRVPEMVAIGVVFTVFIALLFAVIFLLLPLAWSQLATLFNEWPRMIKQGQVLLAGFQEQYPQLISQGQIKAWIHSAGDQVGQLGQWALSFSLSTIPNLVAVLIYLILVPILVFFFLKDKTLILGWFASFLPNERGLMNRIWGEMNRQFANYVRGKVIEIFIVGGVSYIAFTFMGLNYAALLGILVGLSVIIPYIGAAVVTIPVALISAFQWGWTADFFYLMLVYGIIQAIDGNLLVPFLFSEVVNLHPIAIIVAVLFFGGIWGVWGVFFAIPLATLVKAIMDAWPRGDAEPPPPAIEPQNF